ncbi:hypothetical protein BJP34_24020 [Moorena producens PAL-8-15-08-1]|uniref:eCIS core domain-containing protein n=1 Tax=Moorena producens PAL-8-15-08-1 TaxID=1458985 RepID=A0A1D8TWY4_9CYAN|nr:DUF4157 domain-containing protein [Moorena producens]AOX02094.1 hypothetical protein BJP34_24020 [Moorena producens PAL-8-15-08-1]
MGNLRQSQTKKTQARDQSLVSGSKKPTIHPMDELQGIIGNRALGNLIKSQPDKSGQVHRSIDPLLRSVSPVSGQPIQRMPMFRGLSHELRGNLVQAKLTIGEAGDKYELEADRVASEVVNRINAPVPIQKALDDSIQTKEEEEEDKDQLRRQPIVQLEPGDGGMVAAPDLEASIQRARGSGVPLSKKIKEPMDRAFGADFSRVRIHTDAQSDQLNRSIQARAFTTGQDIFFRQGEYNPGSQVGQRLIAHELTHIVQQAGGIGKLQAQPESSSSSKVSAAPTGRIQRGKFNSQLYDSSVSPGSKGAQEEALRVFTLSPEERAHQLKVLLKNASNNIDDFNRIGQLLQGGINPQDREEIAAGIRQKFGKNHRSSGQDRSEYLIDILYRGQASPKSQVKMALGDLTGITFTFGLGSGDYNDFRKLVDKFTFAELDDVLSDSSIVNKITKKFGNKLTYKLITDLAIKGIEPDPGELSMRSLHTEIKENVYNQKLIEIISTLPDRGFVEASIRKERKPKIFDRLHQWVINRDQSVIEEIINNPESEFRKALEQKFKPADIDYILTLMKQPEFIQVPEGENVQDAALLQQIDAILTRQAKRGPSGQFRRKDDIAEQIENLLSRLEDPQKAIVIHYARKSVPLGRPAGFTDEDIMKSVENQCLSKFETQLNEAGLEYGKIARLLIKLKLKDDKFEHLTAHFQQVEDKSDQPDYWVQLLNKELEKFLPDVNTVFTLIFSAQQAANKSEYKWFMSHIYVEVKDKLRLRSPIKGQEYLRRIQDALTGKQELTVGDLMWVAKNYGGKSRTNIETIKFAVEALSGKELLEQWSNFKDLQTESHMSRLSPKGYLKFRDNFLLKIKEEFFDEKLGLFERERGAEQLSFRDTLKTAQRIEIERILLNRLAEEAPKVPEFQELAAEVMGVENGQLAAQYLAQRSKAIGNLETAQLLATGKQWSYFSTRSLIYKAAQGEYLKHFRSGLADIETSSDQQTPEQKMKLLQEQVKSTVAAEQTLVDEETAFSQLRDKYNARFKGIVNTLVGTLLATIGLVFTGGLSAPPAFAMLWSAVSAMISNLVSAGIDWSNQGQAYSHQKALRETFVNMLTASVDGALGNLTLSIKSLGMEELYSQGSNIFAKIFGKPGMDIFANYVTEIGSTVFNFPVNAVDRLLQSSSISDAWQQVKEETKEKLRSLPADTINQYIMGVAKSGTTAGFDELGKLLGVRLTPIRDVATEENTADLIEDRGPRDILSPVGKDLTDTFLLGGADVNNIDFEQGLLKYEDGLPAGFYLEALTEWSSYNSNPQSLQNATITILYDQFYDQVFERRIVNPIVSTIKSAWAAPGTVTEPKEPPRELFLNRIALDIAMLSVNQFSNLPTPTMQSQTRTQWKQIVRGTISNNEAFKKQDWSLDLDKIVKLAVDKCIKIAANKPRREAWVSSSITV